MTRRQNVRAVLRAALAVAVIGAGAAWSAASAAAAPSRIVMSASTEGDPHFFPPGSFRKLEFVDPASGTVQPFGGTGNEPHFHDPSWTGDGSKIAYLEEYYNEINGKNRVVLKTVADGTEKVVLAGLAGRIDGPSLSPTADELASWLVTSDPYYGLFYTLIVTSLDGKSKREVAGPFQPGDLRFAGDQPAWSPDGESIAFSYQGSIVSVRAIGGGVKTLVPATPGIYVAQPSFSPDGKRLAYLKQFQNAGSYVVVRTIDGGAETTAVTGESPFAPFIGPQSWSPDGKQIVYFHFLGCPDNTCDTRLNVVNADGTGDHVLLHRFSVEAVAWGGSAPSYYVKHVEVAQAISPDLGPLLPFEPPGLFDPFTFHWSEASAFGFGIPLVAEKSTLLRVYVGDASLAPGSTERRSLRVNVIDNLTSISYAPPTPRDVDVTALDVAPKQNGARAALNVWLPPEAAKAGLTHRFDVEVNPGEAEPECAGCYPNGNRWTVQDISDQDGGSVVIAPVQINYVTPDSRTVLQPRPADFSAAVNGAIPLLPVSDDGVTITRPAGTLLVDQRELTQDDGCNVLMAYLLELRATGGAGPLEGFGATRWVGYAPKVAFVPGSTYCAGRADAIPGRNIVLVTVSPTNFAHELGHTLGLTHATGRSQNPVPAGATALPYPGIGGVGYTLGAGGVTELFDKATVGDIMSYDVDKWTSPKSWQVMFERILAESGAIRPRARGARATTAAAAKKASAPRPRLRRLVTGVLYSNKAVILSSLVTDALKPVASGPRAARVVATDHRGKVLSTTSILGRPQAEPGQSKRSLAFVVALPADKRIAALAVVPTGKGKPLARLRASKHAPTGRFLKLPKRARVDKPLTVRWLARDRDRRDKLAVIALARRGNGTWRTIAIGPAKGSIGIEPKTLGTGKALRLRLRISDGLHTTVINAKTVRLR